MTRALAIRSHLRNADPVKARQYAHTAARWEELRLAIARRQTTPGDDARYRELSAALRVLSRELNLKVVSVDHGDAIAGITDADGFLPGDPQRMFGIDWQEAADGWGNASTT
jgi:hypothetical protein